MCVCLPHLVKPMRAFHSRNRPMCAMPTRWRSIGPTCLHPKLARFWLVIAFAHRTFAWESDARGKAHVHCVILGLTRRDDEPAKKRLFSYRTSDSDPDETRHLSLIHISEPTRPY